MKGHAAISSDILSRYAADAAREVPGIANLVESHLPRRRGVRIVEEDGKVKIEVHVAVRFGAPIPEAGREVQRRVASYLERMADLRPDAVDVVVDEVAAP